MKKIIYFIIFSLFLSSSAYAGRLVSCQGVSTSQGFRYVGTYCYDFACTYTYTKTYSSYCPYND